MVFIYPKLNLTVPMVEVLINNDSANTDLNFYELIKLQIFMTLSN